MDIKTSFLLLYSISNISAANGQYWEDMGFGPSGQIRGLDSDEHRLIITGQAAGGGFIVNETFLWNGSTVEALPTDSFEDILHRSLLFQGIPYLAQSGGNTDGIYRYVNNAWEQIASAGISGLKVRDSLLYVMLYESTTELNGESFNRIAAFDGEDFHVVDNYLTDNTVGFADLRDAIWYKDEFYVSGNIYLPGLWDIARWNPATGLWSNVGVGFPGDWSAIGMLEHAGLLFVYGEFEESTGCPGNGIVAWDGERYWRLGDGANGTVTDAVVFNGELYISGNFDNINGIECNGLAKWDGSEWCSLPTGVAPTKLVVFQDELYGTGAKNSGVNSPDTVLRFAKWVYEGEPMGCAETGPIGIVEEPGVQGSLVLFPNPSTGPFTLSWQATATEPYSLMLYDAQGRAVQTHNGQTTAGHNAVQLELSHLPSGIYFGRLAAGDGVRSFKWVRE